LVNRGRVTRSNVCQMEYVRREKHYHVFKESVLMGEISENKEK
jgi:hypothetical protein